MNTSTAVSKQTSHFCFEIAVLYFLIINQTGWNCSLHLNRFTKFPLGPQTDRKFGNPIGECEHVPLLIYQVSKLKGLKMWICHNMCQSAAPLIQWTSFPKIEIYYICMSLPWVRTYLEVFLRHVFNVRTQFICSYLPSIFVLGSKHGPLLETSSYSGSQHPMNPQLPVSDSIRPRRCPGGPMHSWRR